MSAGLRKFVLTAHVTFSVGWLGAFAVFLAIALLGLTSQDARMVRATYLVMEPAAWWVLVPLAFGSLLTGLVQSLGSTWGLFRHYWVLFKLLINALCHRCPADVHANTQLPVRCRRRDNIVG